MKKIVLLLLFISTIFAFDASAQVKFGIKAGINFTSVNDIKFDDYKATLHSKTGYQAGLLMQVRLPLGFAIQPELRYASKGVSSSDSFPVIGKPEFKMDYLELPVALQWGINLVLFRPYIEAVPYIGYALYKGDMLSDINWNDLNRFNYGVGLGIGVEIWKFQVSGRYNWSFGDIGGVTSSDDVIDAIKSDMLNESQFRGVELSLAFLF